MVTSAFSLNDSLHVILCCLLYNENRSSTEGEKTKEEKAKDAATKIKSGMANRAISNESSHLSLSGFYKGSTGQAWATDE